MSMMDDPIFIRLIYQECSKSFSPAEESDRFSVPFTEFIEFGLQKFL
jgi:hypothetical protein